MDESLVDKVAAQLPPPELPPVYHQPTGNKFYWLNPHDHYWQEMTQETVKTLLIANYTLSASSPGRGQLSQVDRFISRIKVEQRIDAAVNLGWEEMGICELEGKRVLVKRGAERIEPVAGDFPEIWGYLDRLLGEEQLPYFLSWLAIAARGFYKTDVRRYGQALVLAGPRGTGKSFLQMKVITPVLGGRVGRPYGWLTGKEDFNSDLFEAVHLISEDDFHMADVYSRKAFGAAIKRVTANTSQSYNEKHGTKGTFYPYWRLSMSLNGEAHHLATLPDLEDSITDKLIILETFGDAITLATHGDNGNQMEKVVKQELPSFIHHLLHVHQIPKELRDSRYGVKAFINPSVREKLEDIGYEQMFLEYLRETAYPTADGLFKTRNMMLQEVEDMGPHRQIRKVLEHSAIFEEVMRKLVKVQGSGVATGKNSKGTKGWKLTFENTCKK